MLVGVYAALAAIATGSPRDRGPVRSSWMYLARTFGERGAFSSAVRVGLQCAATHLDPSFLKSWGMFMISPALAGAYRYAELITLQNGIFSRLDFRR